MWDFDNDGITDSNASTNVSFTYPIAGSYIASLKISNGSGCESTSIQQVQVIAQPNVSFRNSISCTDETVEFTDLTTDANPGATYSWDFDGDGTIDDNSSGNSNYTFNTKGSYSSELTVTNDPGCSSDFTLVVEVRDRPIPSIDVIAKCYGQESQMIDLTANVDPNATYTWDFDNNGIVDDQTKGSTSFIYPVYNSYVAKLVVDNGGGCAAETEELVVFTDAATPDFSYSSTCEGVEVIFTDLSADLVTGATYSWDFDNNGLEDSQYPGSTSFTFANAGTYNAKLTIDNGGNCLAIKTIPLEVSPPPAVDLGPDVFLCNDSTVVLDAGTGYNSYFWPDDSSFNQTYTINEVGSYSVFVEDAKNCQNSDTIRVAYLGDPEPSFEYVYQLSLDGIYVNFSNTTSNGTMYRWEFGDGTPPVFDESPIHLFQDYFFYKETYYDVCLYATNDCERNIEPYCQTISLSPTALDEDNIGIAVYPNPASDYISVEFLEANVIPLQVQLFDAKGKSVWQRTQPSAHNEIDVSKMDKGVYVLVLVQKDGLFYRNVVIN